MSELTQKQERFVEEFLLDLNATQAAIRAGYGERSAKVQGCRMLTNDNISRAIADRLMVRAKRTELSQDEIIEALREVRDRCMQRKPVMVFDRESRQMVQKIDVKTGEGMWTFDSSGANRALELLGKHLGMFTDRRKVEAEGAFNVIVCNDSETLLQAQRMTEGDMKQE